MPATFEYLPNLTQETGRNQQFNFQGVLVYAQFDRACYVRVTGDTVTAANIQQQAEAFMMVKIPKGTPDDYQPLATARQYQTRPYPASDDTLIVVVSFIYNQPAWDTTVWTIESDSYAEQEESDVQFDPNDPTQTKFIPIEIKNYVLDWLSPTSPFPTTPLVPSPGPGIPSSGGDESAQPPAFGLVVAPRRRKRWTYTKQIYSRDAAYDYDNATDKYIGRINSVAFTGVNQSGVAQNRNDPPGTVLCMDAGLRFSPYVGQYIAFAVICLNPGPGGWQPFARFSNSILGVPDNLWRPGTPDSTGKNAGNGMIQTTAIATANLNDLLALI